MASTFAFASGIASRLTPDVLRTRSDFILAMGLVFAVFLWGGNNAGTRHIVGTWPPIWTGATRFACAGLLLMAVLRWTGWFGKVETFSAETNRRLWLNGAVSLAAYVVCFNWALRLTSASHVAVYLGASPVWALLWEGKPARSWQTAQRFGAAMLALTGVIVLFAPALKQPGGHWLGEILGVSCGVLWTHYGRQCRVLGSSLSGIAISAYTMWRAGMLLLIPGSLELMSQGVQWRVDLALIQLYCIAAGGVIAFGIWNHALRHWPASQVLLFNNLIPLSTTAWAYFCLNEPLSVTFWIAMILIVCGVVLGQTNWQKLLRPAQVPPE